jgi:hypothetical protein
LVFFVNGKFSLCLLGRLCLAAQFAAINMRIYHYA